ncbi:flagellar hook-length control protein FliK [Roseateles sp. BYS96W]|uniref:Flagellar hook-length control protein FliK n=1 Tax=Pelomonas nitida TaxID=3299027 RepID=A0ABW7G4D3_9BURK
MLASTAITTPKPAASLPPAGPAPQPANTAGSAPAFAHFLTSQTAPPPPSPEPEARSPDTNATVAAQRRQAAQPPKPATPKPPGDGTAKAEAKPSETGRAEAGADDAVSASDDDQDDTATPQLKEFTQLIGLNTQPADATARPDTRQARAAADAADEQTGAPTAGPRDTRADARTAKAGEQRADAAKSAQLAELTAHSADQRAAEPLTRASAERQGGEPAAVTGQTGAPSFAAALAQAMPASAVPADTPGTAPATHHAAVHTDLHDGGFGSELGTRISLMAVDGVQQAELQLNPADMGPVAVQITVDGSQAQVSFHAAQAETRQALEQSLPDLAAALQGQGLTLSGGGVFQQSRRDAEPGNDRSSSSGPGRSTRGAGGSIAATGNATAAPVRRSVGLLDTFA